MRDIKFRAWFKEQRHMENEIIVLGASDAVFRCGYDVNGHMTPENTVLMQYTGLKDDNDVEICEGDIIHYINTKCHGWQLEETRNNFKGVVEWNDSDITFDVNSTINSIRLSEWHYECCRVIGNIYENTELLESKQ